MAGNEEEKRSGKPGAEGVKLFKGGKYEEAIKEFDKFLKTMSDDGTNKKVALYNRGMSYYNLRKYDMAIEDGESCLKIDPSWVKGYKCKGLALEGLGKRRDAIDIFRDGQKMCNSLDGNTDAILNPLIEKLNLKIAEDEIENSQESKSEEAAAKGVELFKEGKYKEAIKQFTTYLETEQDDKSKKIAHYNRGMAHNNLGQHDSALEDGEECLKIDQLWAKGYKCKGLALEGMGRPRDAVDTLLDGRKMCLGYDQNTEAVLGELIKRLNKETGFLEADLDLFERQSKEKYCVVCDLFEKDMSRSLKLDDGKKFVSCDRCKMVSYCCRQHREKDRATHDEICEELLMLRKKSEEDFDIEIFPREDSLVLLVLNPKTPKGEQMVNMMKRFAELPPDFKNILDCLRDDGYGKLMPLYQLIKFKPITKAQQKELNTWDDLLTLPTILNRTTTIPQMTANLDRDIKRELTDVLTDPMTVFYAMKQVALLDNDDGDKVISLHIVGAETEKEIFEINIVFDVLSNITRRKLRIVFIGPLLRGPPGQVQIYVPNPAITLFRGTYQDYILTSDYEKPDFIVAFYPGLYDENWLPVVAQAIAKRIPFLVTCDNKGDYQKTKEWLMSRKFVKAEIFHDCLNPFCSWQAFRRFPGRNSVSKRNMFSLLLMGGDLDGLRPFLRVEDEKVEDLCRLGGMNSLSDIMKLNRSGKM